ncbi:hypothetical protein ACWIWK_08920 [Helicobacter sp. 23-1048]
MTRQIIQKASLYFGVLLAGFILCGCGGRPHHLNLYNKFYTPVMSEKEVKTLKSSGDYPKKVIAKTSLSIKTMQNISYALINFYGCAYIGGSEFIGEDEYLIYGFNMTKFSTDDVKDPERLAQKVGANYYITYSETTNSSVTTTSGADTKVAAQGGMGRAQTNASTTTTSTRSVWSRGALFYLCD